MDFLKNLTHDEHPNAVPATKQEDLGDNILERFADKLNISEAPKSAAAAAAPPVPEHKSLFDKLGDAVDGLSGKRTPPPPPAPEKSDNIFEKIGDMLKGEKKPASPPPPPPQAEGLFDKVGDKFNNMLGGGAAGEAEEDHLDKGTITDNG